MGRNRCGAETFRPGLTAIPRALDLIRRKLIETIPAQTAPVQEFLR
jgi:hypothetical protein